MLNISSNSKIVVFAPNWLGDILLITPGLRALKEQYPSAKISCIVPPSCKDLLENQHCVDQVIPLSDRSLFGKWTLLNTLKKQSFDVGILLHRSNTRARIFKCARIPNRIGYATKQRTHLLTHSYPEPSKDLHKMDYLLDVFKQMGVRSIPSTYEYTPPHLSSKFPSCELPSQFIVFHPGSNWKPKRWPTQHYVTLGRSLIRKYSVPIVISGSLKDRPLANVIKEEIFRDHQISALQNDKVISFTGKTSLQELSGLLSKAWFVVSGDTGPLHLAAAIQTPVIALFGPTSPILNGPRGKGPIKVLWNNPECFSYPCLNPWCTHNTCLETLSPEKVLSEIENWSALHE